MLYTYTASVLTTSSSGRHYVRAYLHIFYYCHFIVSSQFLLHFISFYFTERTNNYKDATGFLYGCRVQITTSDEFHCALCALVYPSDTTVACIGADLLAALAGGKEKRIF